METHEALRLATERGLDLVEIAPHLRPPVCRIIDYGKHLYQLEKKARESRVHHRQSEIKGIRITVRAAKHDLETRIKQLERFLQKGNKVRVEMILRGREKALRGFAQNRMEEFLALIPDIPWQIEQPIKREPNGLSVILVSSVKPSKKPVQSAPPHGQKKDKQIGS